MQGQRRSQAAREMRREGENEGGKGAGRGKNEPIDEGEAGGRE
jgi:hypothetical protein